MEPLNDKPVPRRRFLTTVWWLLGGAAFLEAVWIGASFLRPRRTKQEEGTGLVVAGPVERFEDVRPFHELREPGFREAHHRIELRGKDRSGVVEALMEIVAAA